MKKKMYEDCTLTQCTGVVFIIQCSSMTITITKTGGCFVLFSIVIVIVIV